MKKGNLNIKIDYKPFSTFKNVVVENGSNRQNYNANTRYFEPDRRIDPYVVLIECGVNDTHNIVSGLVNAQLTDVVWQISTPTGYKIIETTDNSFKIGTGSEKGKLTVYKNVSDLEPVTILFSARFLHAQTGRMVNFQESFNLVTLPVASAPVMLETSAPVGYNMYPTENNQGLLCAAALYQGADKLPAAYWWYKNNTLLTDTNGYQGTAKEKLFVPAAELSKTGNVFKCEVADCSEYFNQLIEQKVEADPQVFEWRDLYQSEGENFIKKSFFKGNNGDLSVEGWKINNPNGTAEATEIVDSQFGGFDKAYKIKVSNGRAFLAVSSSVYINYLPVEIGDKVTVSVLATGDPLDAWFVQYDAAKNILNNISGRVFSINEEKQFLTMEIASADVKFIGLSRIGIGTAGSRSGDVTFEKIKFENGDISTDWSPSKFDLENLIVEKTEYYTSETTLPENYRPDPKPEKIYKGDFMLRKVFPVYQEEVLYPTTVSPESDSVQVEMVLNTNNGIIPNPEDFFSVGWLKQPDSTFKYKGFKVNIDIADIVSLTENNQQLDYELREDLTLTP